MVSKTLITAPCIEDKCVMWKKCKEQKKDKEKYLIAKGKEVKEWVCKWVRPGSYDEELDEDRYQKIPPQFR